MKTRLPLLFLLCCVAMFAQAQNQEVLIVKALQVKQSAVEGLSNFQNDVYTITSKGVLKAKKNYRIRVDRAGKQFVIEHQEAPMSNDDGSSDKKPIPGCTGIEFQCLSHECSTCKIVVTTVMVCSACEGCYGGVILSEDNVSQVEFDQGGWGPSGGLW